MAIAVILDVLLDHLRRDFVSNGARKIAIFPELTASSVCAEAPQLPLNLRGLTKDGTGTMALE